MANLHLVCQFWCVYLKWFCISNEGLAALAPYFWFLTYSTRTRLHIMQKKKRKETGRPPSSDFTLEILFKVTVIGAVWSVPLFTSIHLLRSRRDNAGLACWFLSFLTRLFWSSEQRGRTLLECHVWHTYFCITQRLQISLTGYSSTLGALEGVEDFILSEAWHSD